MAECANPLLLSWVKEWLDTARERNSKGVTTYKKAYDSLKSCPLPFTHPSEAQQLTGFGPKLCSRLTDKLKEYCTEHDLPMPEMPQKQKGSGKNGGEEGGDEDVELKKKKTRKPKPYVPALRSGAYALILALSTLGENAPNGLTKPQTIELAQPHCDSSFTAPSDPTKFYTAWNSMKTLVEKDLVCEKGRPLRKYSLTDEGWDVARRIKKSSDPSRGRMDTFVAADKPAAAPDKSNEDSFVELGSSPLRPTVRVSSESPAKLGNFADLIPQGEVISNASALPAFTPIILEPGTFTVELVLDVREIRAKSDRDYMQSNLITSGVKPIMRALELGDILWVAKVRDPALLFRLGAEGDEVLLDYIVERKRLDDLVSSIKDGRFHEQKFRLRKSGIKNIIYIIEEISMNADHFQKYEEAVQSAIAGTQVVEGYFIKKTQKMDDTIRYLVSMTKLLKQRYEKKPLHLIPTQVITTGNYMPLVEHLRKTKPATEFYITYTAFASLSSKSETLTLRDVYLKMLMCTRGVTGEKALEIQKRWTTPNEFVEAYKKIEEKEGNGEQGRKRKMELVSSEMGNLMGRKKIQKALSVKIAEVWGDV
jgi:crossover junction endonuclease MUS81